MQRITGLPVALAFFIRTGRGVRSSSLEMCWLNWLIHAQARPEGSRYFPDSKQLTMRIGTMHEGLTLIDEWIADMIAKNAQRNL